MRTLLVFTLFFLLSGCSQVFQSAGSTESRRAVTRVSADYLQNLVAGKTKRTFSLLDWVSFQDANEISQGEFATRARTVAVLWPPESHPLFELDFVNAKVRGDKAVVTFQRFQRPDLPEVEVALRWGGRGWLVTDDSLFGPGELLRETSPRP